MRITVHIQNLKYRGCEKTIINRLSGLKNISEVEVNQNEESVSFDYHTAHDFERVKHLLSGIGYPIIGSENKLYTKPKSYVSCDTGKIKKL